MAPKSDKEKKPAGKTNPVSGKESAKTSSKPKKQIEEDEKYLKDKIKGYCPQCGNTDVKVGSKYYAFGLINTWTLDCPKCGEWEIQEIEKN